MTYLIEPLITTAQVLRSYNVMRQLRPHLTCETYLKRAGQQAELGYLLVGAIAGEDMVGVAGYRYLTNLAWGHFLYVDDLVTDESRRSQGAGKALLDWLRAEAIQQGCDELHLDSGVQRVDAHRFYDREGLQRTSYHFAIKLSR
jgi:GNAT superfamily N-acetyltransferase